MYRSPGGPLSGAASPCPSSLSWYPSGIPTGIFTVIFRSLFTSPCPLHVLHGEVIVWPVPLQSEHSAICTNALDPLLLIFWTFPEPLHTLHVCIEEPGAAPVPLQTGHLSILGTWISFSVPFAASSRVM